MVGALLWFALSYLAGAVATYGVLGRALIRGARHGEAVAQRDGRRWSEEVGAAARRAAPRRSADPA
jgi:hypothetical protein